ncbi:hypothetical protein [Thermomonospora cellulosilytica]|uniref:Uncharacterized protein n=1 Tax=Thermomonospora cellulosilytica TaxID=1411118 RepID=A0A7W3N5L8_9ACTN|nr:hypothetical protein [Thermomonospora cellulosilytica]MBA9007970.1 hypothetical protein [Thermomonospora cellulosilytica]
MSAADMGPSFFPLTVARALLRALWRVRRRPAPQDPPRDKRD